MTYENKDIISVRYNNENGFYEEIKAAILKFLIYSHKISKANSSTVNN